MTSRRVSSRWRACATTAAAIVVLISALAAAEAATKKLDKKAEAAKPNLIASFGDWNVFVGQAGRGKICYALAQPKSREPAAKRDAGYAFISDRPAEGVRNEVSFIMGFDVAGGLASSDKADKGRLEAQQDEGEGRSQGEGRGQGEDRSQGQGGPGACRHGRGGDVRPPAQGRQSLGEERRPRERPHRRDEKGRVARSEGRRREGRRHDRQLFPHRILAGHGPPGEGMPGQGMSPLSQAAGGVAPTTTLIARRKTGVFRRPIGWSPSPFPLRSTGEERRRRLPPLRVSAGEGDHAKHGGGGAGRSAQSSP